jgi:hypothetical protein
MPRKPTISAAEILVRGMPSVAPKGVRKERSGASAAANSSAGEAKREATLFAEREETSLAVSAWAGLAEFMSAMTEVMERAEAKSPKRGKVTSSTTRGGEREIVPDDLGFRSGT